jgi:hypothetical protein
MSSNSTSDLLDDELRLFQEEIASVEEEAKKRQREEAEEIARKRQKAMEVAKAIMAQPKTVAPIATQVIIKAPAPLPEKPQPSSIDKTTSSSIVPPQKETESTNAAAKNVSFMYGQSVPSMLNAAVQIDMIDHTTGMPMSAKDQHTYSQQQSVYRYSPETKTKNAVNQSGKKFLRTAAGKTWEDATLAEWPENDYRLFCGDLGNEVGDELLSHAFSSYSSFAMAKVIRNKVTHKSRVWYISYHIIYMYIRMIGIWLCEFSGWIRGCQSHA